MRRFTLRVIEIAAVGGLVHVTCDGGSQPIPSPGQVCLARLHPPQVVPQGEGGAAAQPFLRVPIYPFHGRLGQPEFWVGADHAFAPVLAGEAGPGLAPGATLDLIGPCGHGFDLPHAIGRVLVATDGGLERLLPLVHFSLQRSLAVTVLALSGHHPSVGQASVLLPADAEIQAGPITADLAAWADVVALDVPDAQARAREVRALCPDRPAAFVQALITPPMPCGVGACQACWARTENGQHLACVDGPVFEV